MNLTQPLAKLSLVELPLRQNTFAWFDLGEEIVKPLAMRRHFAPHLRKFQISAAVRLVVGEQCPTLTFRGLLPACCRLFV